MAAHLFLATPCYGGQAHEIYVRGLLAMGPACRERGITLHTELGGGEALIPRARGAMLAQFLASPATHLMFIDADVGFAPDAVFRLLEAGKDLIGGAYPRKVQPAGGETAWEGDPLPGETLAGRGVQKVGAVGTGFLLVSRAAAQRITDGYPQLLAQLGDVKGSAAAQAAMVFDPVIESGTARYLVDHQAFCARWRALGGEVWIDFELGLTHLGEVAHGASV